MAAGTTTTTIAVVGAGAVTTTTAMVEDHGEGVAAAMEEAARVATGDVMAVPPRTAAPHSAHRRPHVMVHDM